ncbi:MAG: sigma 54-interacting transcriptional regulator [Novosphingobium sp.]
MTALDYSAAAAKAHAPLIQRAAAVLGVLGQDASAPVRIMDAGESQSAPSGTAAISLTRGDHPALLRRPGTGRHALTYTDPTSEAALAALVACATPSGKPIAVDPESLSILALAERLAASEIPVLINGPTGTGKEVLSRFIHDHSPRRNKPFIAVNCAAMPETMLEAMLFGHQKGAFTGATGASEGFFRAADGGTLLLDEVAEMPLPLQAKLLRALQEGEVVPIGATTPIKVDVRVIACANRDLPLEVQEGRFRADLYYRINVFPLTLRPLRERSEDVAPLAFALLLRHTPAQTHLGQSAPWISDSALAMLRHHGWPGNVRELENVMRRALLLAAGSPAILPEHIQFDSAARLVGTEPPVGPETMSVPVSGAGGRRLSNIVQLHEARAIMDTLAQCGGSRVAAARLLGISERTLRYRLASFRDAGIGAEKVAISGAGR